MVNVRGYKRTKKGKVENVKPHVRKNKESKKFSKGQLAQISFSEAAKIRDKIEKENPRDLNQSAEVTFEMPNKAWKSETKRIDAIKYDASKPPVVREMPSYGIPGTLVSHEGVVYKSDVEGRYAKTKKKY